MMKARLCIVVAMLVILSAPAAAGTQTYGFDDGRWGFNGSYGDMSFGSFTNFFYIENNDGQPAPCLRMKSIHGIGIKVERPEFQGNYKAAGYTRISLDMKMTSMFPSPNNPNPRPQIFILPGHGMSPWVKDASGYQPVMNQWQTVWADFDPNWTDAQAQANGWNVVVIQNAPSKSFKDTLADVYATGFWFRISSVGSEIHGRFDNYTLGPSTSSPSPVLKPTPLKPKSRVVVPQKSPYPYKKKQ